MNDISISNLRLCCRYIDQSEGEEEVKKEDEQSSPGFKIEKKDLKLASKHEMEIILKAVPLRAGEIVIEKV